ncbi:helix-turn-helix domain-containing protein [Paenibacillus sp. GCM10012307]|uniref:Response regulator n=1 Tax=Paenibacillus roseus TaxID=2798579 RepID=A0A934J4N6_9BACL|nr:helix-turn-helix domain-containing protein [Paenibacillus roseus]MBJ6360756.1 response regulator [Paenibacillus roseus]
MFKVLIVEDEMLVRVGLTNSIAWSKYDMEVIADVSNGREALAIYMNEKPDLIVTDLKMPVMDGLELISTIRSKDVDTKILILSCIDDFEYARKAANLKVSGYILKLTMTMEEIEGTLEEIRKELVAHSYSFKPPVQQQLSLDLLKEKVLKDYLFYGVYSEDEMGTIMQQFEPPIHTGPIAVAILETYQYDRLHERFDDDRGKLIQFSILNILNEIMVNHGGGIAYHDQKNRYLMIFSFLSHHSAETNRSRLTAVFDNIQKAMHSYFNVPVFISVSATGEGFHSMRRFYQECTRMLNDRYFSHTAIITSVENRIIGEPKFKKLIANSCNKWALLGESYYKNLQETTFHALKQPLQDEGDWKQVFIHLMEWTRAYLAIPDDQAALMELSGTERILVSPTIYDSIQAWENYLEETAKLKHMIKSVTKEVAEAVKYIQMRYDQDITLKEISELVNLSPNYLSLLFKKNMGRNLIEYLTDYRIEKAKELLQKTNLKTYEIAENVGFSDSAYFSRIFKKVTGISPLEFRKIKVLGGTAKHEDI